MRRRSERWSDVAHTNPSSLGAAKQTSEGAAARRSRAAWTAAEHRSQASSQTLATRAAPTFPPLPHVGACRVCPLRIVTALFPPPLPLLFPSVL